MRVAAKRCPVTREVLSTHEFRSILGLVNEAELMERERQVNRRGTSGMHFDACALLRPDAEVDAEQSLSNHAPIT